MLHSTFNDLKSSEKKKTKIAIKKLYTKQFKYVWYATICIHETEAHRAYVENGRIKGRERKNVEWRKKNEEEKEINKLCKPSDLWI